MIRHWHFVQSEDEHFVNFVVVFHDGHKLGASADAVIDDLRDWCIHSFGVESHGGRWWERDDRFVFRNTADAIMFKLRWQ